MPNTASLPVERTALVVDDEPTVRMLARTILSAAGFSVPEAADSKSARETVKNASRTFDLIFLDLSLLGESGAALIPEFRAQSPGSRILLVSGSGAESATRHAADGFLSKPFTRAALLNAVQAVFPKV